MNKSKRILKVPKELVLRNKLRKEVKLLCKKVNLLPPAPFNQMEKLAIGLLKELDISDEYTDFVVVLIGNESWRKTVEATPFNRRLLLLPQCLKDNSSCKGIFDELGLNCAGCKKCPIDNILLEAEKLGYSTLIAEGTTVAIGLVEEGSIDAVIGVSCMPVLQRSFEPVSNAAVPVIGLPLMYDGCENTKIDLKWLYDEIMVFNNDKNYSPISVSELKHKVSNFFVNGELGNYFQVTDKTEKMAVEYLKIGGQRMRPLIAALSFSAYSGSENNEIIYPLSLIIECFHKASLIHDDIADNSDYRYEMETAHKKFGIPQAINVGDYLIGKGYRILSELPVDEKTIAKGLKRISESHLMLTKGQGADILFNTENGNPGLGEALEIFKNKTGEAIKVALLLGAIVGGSDESELQILEQFANLFGISYQIRDDLNEYREENKDEKIEDFPFLSALLNDNSSSKNIENIIEFRKQITEHNLVDKADEILNNYVLKCFNKLDKLRNEKLRLSLYAVLGKVFKPLNADV